MSGTPDVGPPDAYPPGYPFDLQRSWRARDGTLVAIRPLRPADLQLESAFVAGLSADSLYQRLQYAASALDPAQLARLLELDYVERLALGAFVECSGVYTLIGVSRYARVEGTSTGECAIVVADAWQGQGLGTELMRQLAHAGRDRGLTAFEGVALASNHDLHDWARRFSFQVATDPQSGGNVRVTLDLSRLPA